MTQQLTARVAVSGVTYWVDRPYTYELPPELAERVRPGVRVAVSFGGGRLRDALVLAMGGQTEKRLKPILTVLDDEPLLSERQLRLALWMRERFFCTVMDAARAMLPSGLWSRISSEYRLADGMDERSAYEAAGRSRGERVCLETVLAHGGTCALTDIEAVFSGKNPASALAGLVKKGVLLPQARASRRVGERSIQRAALAVTPDKALSQAAKNPRAVRQGAVLRVLAELGEASVADLCYFTGAGRESVRALEKKGFLVISSKPAERRPEGAADTGGAEPLPSLTESQQRVFEGLLALVDSREPQAALLYGVTGSGKTSVYIRLIDAVMRRGRTAILLVPEIALTPQMLRAFSAHFGDTVAVLHSSLSMGERCDEWRRIRAGRARLVIGTRSAVFAPTEELGLIIIDEEQEGTYKSESTPRYHAREVAKYLCAKAGATLVMGSATPDITTKYGADTGRYRLFTLPERYNARGLPSVYVADMRRELENGNFTGVSEVLRREIEENLRRDEQTILFLNRRGASKLVLCPVCGYTYKCPNCSANLTYHSVGDRLICHYCGFAQRVDTACPNCGGKLNFVGAGTQKLVEQLGELFPGVPVLRMDADSVAPVGSHRTLFEQFRARRIPILVGTQMVAKGLNFENVTLVGVLSADQSLYCGGYRAGERTFSLITQVIGRSGRFEKPGRAVVQSFTPDNPIIRYAAAQDYDGFYRTELAARRVTDTPPFSVMYALTAAGEDLDDVTALCGELRERLEALTRDIPGAYVLGPAPMPVARVNRIWRYRVTVAGPEGRPLRQAIGQTLAECGGESRRGLSLYAECDPVD